MKKTKQEASVQLRWFSHLGLEDVTLCFFLFSIKRVWSEAWIWISHWMIRRPSHQLSSQNNSVFPKSLLGKSVGFLFVWAETPEVHPSTRWHGHSHSSSALHHPLASNTLALERVNTWEQSNKEGMLGDILERVGPICIHTQSLSGCLSEGSGLSASIKDSPPPDTPVQDKWHRHSWIEQLPPRPPQGSQICMNQINKHVLGNRWGKISDGSTRAG